MAVAASAQPSADAQTPNPSSHRHEPEILYIVPEPFKPLSPLVGVRIRGTLGDIDPHNKVPFKRARSKVKKGPL